MSEFDTVNGKLDRILALLGDVQTVPVTDTPTPVPEPDWDGTGNPPSQKAWTKWRDKLDPITRGAYAEIWRPTTPQSGGGGGYQLVHAIQSGEHWIGPKLGKGTPVKMQSIANTTISFPIEPDASKFSIAPVGGGSGNTFNLWLSDTPDGPATFGSPYASVGDAAALSFSPEDKQRFVNLRARGASDPLFVQTN